MIKVLCGALKHRLSFSLKQATILHHSPPA